MARGCSPSSGTKIRSGKGFVPRIVIAPEARQDLREIRAYIARDDPKAAGRVVTRLRDIMRMLARAPAMGRARPELAADLRSFVADRHVLFYRPLKGAAGIEIARVLDGARDVDAAVSLDRA
jgi:toxin ParE1/3/4